VFDIGDDNKDEDLPPALPTPFANPTIPLPIRKRRYSRSSSIPTG